MPKNSPLATAAHYAYSIQSRRNETTQPLIQMKKHLQERIEKNPEKYPKNSSADKLEQNLRHFLWAAENANNPDDDPEKRTECREFLNLAAADVEAINKSMADLKEESPELFSEISGAVEKWNNEEAIYTGACAMHVGEVKSAARWIEETQERIKRQDEVSIDDVARIFALWKLANSEPGSRARLDAMNYSEAEVDIAAEELKRDPVFRDYLKQQNYSFDKDMALAGHGGRLEKTFSDYIKDRPDGQQLDKNKYGRYQFAERFSTMKAAKISKNGSKQTAMSRTPRS